MADVWFSATTPKGRLVGVSISSYSSGVVVEVDDMKGNVVVEHHSIEPVDLEFLCTIGQVADDTIESMEAVAVSVQLA